MWNPLGKLSESEVKLKTLFSTLGKCTCNFTVLFLYNTSNQKQIMLLCNIGEKPFKCDQCDFACIQSFDLVKHKFTHSGDKPYKCDVCPKQFTRPARLRDHMRTHTGEKPYICDVCGKGFAIQTGLKSHQVSLTLKVSEAIIISVSSYNINTLSSKQSQGQSVKRKKKFSKKSMELL